MTTIHITGGRRSGLNYFFASQLVDDYGPEEALNKTTGPAREAVEHYIKDQGLQVDRSKVEPDTFPRPSLQGSNA